MIYLVIGWLLLGAGVFLLGLGVFIDATRVVER